MVLLATAVAAFHCSSAYFREKKVLLRQSETTFLFCKFYYLRSRGGMKCHLMSFWVTIKRKGKEIYLPVFE